MNQLKEESFFQKKWKCIRKHVKKAKSFLQKLNMNGLHKSIGDCPIVAGVTEAPPDKENNLSNRNQKLMKKQFHIRKSVHHV